MSRKADQTEAILLTGFPSYLARRLGLEILQTRPNARVFLLHAAGEAASRVEVALASLKPSQRERVVPLQGDVSFMNLGLPSEEYRRLVDEVTEIQHLASRYSGHRESEGRGQRTAALLRRTNVNGTREVLELAGQCRRLRCMVHWSTVLVSGCREGVVLEDELECGQRFRSPYEQTRYEAERLVARAARKLPVMVLRCGVVVGDSDSGELASYEGPHRLVASFVQARREQPVILPGTGDAPVHLVPVDFVVRAGCFLSTDESAVGKTFHLVDPSPLPARSVYQLIARKAHRKPVAQAVPAALARLIRLSPRVERLTPFPVAPADLFDRMVFYNCQNTLMHLEGTRLQCPPFASYVDRLVRFINDADEARRAAVEEQFVDPLY